MNSMDDIMFKVGENIHNAYETVIKSLLSIAGVNTDHTDMERIEREMKNRGVVIAEKTEQNKTTYMLVLKGKEIMKGEVWYEFDFEENKAVVKRKLTPMSKLAPTD